MFSGTFIAFMITAAVIIIGINLAVKQFQTAKTKQLQEGRAKRALQEFAKDLSVKQVETTKAADGSQSSTATKVAPEAVIDPKLAKYMQKLEPTVSNMVNFFQDFLLFNGVSDKLRMHLTDQNGSSPSDELSTIFLTDLAYISEKSGHPVSMQTAESCGFISLMLRLRSSTPCEIDWKRLTLQTIVNNEIDVDALVAELKQNRAPLERAGDTFLFPSVFADFSPDATKKYMRLLYDFSAALANIDGKLTLAEIQWLQFMEKYIGGNRFANRAKDVKFSPRTLKYKDASDSTDEMDGAAVTAKVTKLSAEQCAEDAEKKLNELIGLSSVKQEVITFRNFLKIQNERRKKGLSVPPTSYHLVFSGNPGTGKTTIARIMAQILKSLGVISSGHLVEASRSDLVAGYMGQTAIKTNKVIDSALNGVLFIDEAYTLSRSSENDFGQEAIDTLLKRMEDDRDRLVVIIAGYTDEIKNFVNSNPGLASRFNRYINFPDYTESELEEIFKALVDQYDYTLNESGRRALQDCIAKAVSEKDNHFGNGRFVRNLFEKTIERQANRLARVEHLGAVNISEIDGKDF
ncbi:AAA family ATPase [Fibrobacter sp. UWEL]|uniref:AAA family ATPase n=1 Tax=Fibrobacter sp. UWEL TaxID=1896209 RepID=UPI000910E22E|nr:AAA family ATPase [Fibrobacter sp. UWEL]SHK96597.1 type VII secretion AAA-ATPase EccA [Fibrobacter sp. UWEL]